MKDQRQLKDVTISLNLLVNELWDHLNGLTTLLDNEKKNKVKNSNHTETKEEGGDKNAKVEMIEMIDKFIVNEALTTPLLRKLLGELVRLKGMSRSHWTSDDHLRQRSAQTINGNAEDDDSDGDSDGEDGLMPINKEEEEEGDVKNSMINEADQVNDTPQKTPSQNHLDTMHVSPLTTPPPPPRPMIPPTSSSQFPSSPTLSIQSPLLSPTTPMTTSPIPPISSDVNKEGTTPSSFSSPIPISLSIIHHSNVPAYLEELSSGGNVIRALLRALSIVTTYDTLLKTCPFDLLQQHHRHHFLKRMKELASISSTGVTGVSLW
eukprot:CAMPEP_0114395528 /NCGR_PEP_ID=MMETSP0102-20121206/12954_1 /TAXON_ID=38822 ORGANISM="Pteridomonas danica, Strain PT" /NCGR_SAMPLE_ID=MMETSP0102 /ASSEMBLY_ACC=CAM_ASM_000212 /LENGTH=319 /DNA_ID=CAMNT_0001555929 /DNA_START=154 /DNA_END=1111 /DNA_ORIENTATION=-